MPTLSDFYKIEYNRLLSYYQDKQLAFSVFKFLYEYTFQQKFFLVNNKTIFSKIKKQEFMTYIDQITILDMPFQYILKYVPFLDTEIEVTPPVLIPRSETEWWVNYLTKKLQEKKNKKLFIADFCSGSGCIGIGLLKFFERGLCDSFDNMPQAIYLAAKNAQSNGVKSRYKVYLKDILNLKKHKKYDIVVSNPPYISLSDYEKLDNSVKNWEKKSALTDEKNGYTIILHLLMFVKKNLKKNSILCIEICESYGQFLLKYTNEIYPHDFVFLLKDQYNKKRVLIVVKGEYKKFFENIYETR